MAKKFDYSGALAAGYTDEEITPTLREQHPDFDYEGAVEAGYTPQQINRALSTYKKPLTTTQQIGRYAEQLGLGLAEGATPAYQIATLPAQLGGYSDLSRERIGEDLEHLFEKNQGRPIEEWDQNDKDMYQHLSERVQKPSLVQQEQQAIDLSTSGLYKQLTGRETHPEGIAENAFRWYGFLKDPTKVFKGGATKKEILKNILPTQNEALSSLGAGTALNMAQEGQFGPLGTIAVSIVGHAAGQGASGLLKGTGKLLTNPKETIAKGVVKLLPQEKIDLQKSIIEDFRKSGIQADFGTLTNNNLIKMAQTRLSQTAFAGEAKHQFIEQIKDEYKALAATIGELKFQNIHEGSQIMQETLQGLREADLNIARELYRGSDKALKEGAAVDPMKLARSVLAIEEKLIPGAVKSTEQKKVLDLIQTLKGDIFTKDGKLKMASVKALINNNIALKDIIDWEVQGGTKKLLRGLVGDVDRAIISHGKENIPFVRNYINAKKKFSQHAKTYRNKSATSLLASRDPTAVYNKMNSVQGIRDIQKMVGNSPEGKALFDSLKRMKFDNIFENNLVNNINEQVKLGTFSNALKKGKNREIVRELMDPESFNRLQRLQKNSARLANTADQYYNASKSGTTLADAAIIAKGINDLVHLINGNPWPLVQTIGGIYGARKLNQLVHDPAFLKNVEEAMLASEKGDTKSLLDIMEHLKPKFFEIASR